MNQRIKLALLAAVSLLLGCSFIVWIIGSAVEQRMQHGEEDFLQRVTTVSLIKRSYHRGVFGASEELTLGFGRSVVQLAHATALTALSSARLTVRNTITYGPFPRLRGVALATVDSELLPSADVAKRLDAILGGKPALSIHTRLGWFGDRTSRMTSPAFQTELTDGAKLASRGMTGMWTTTRHSQSSTFEYATAGVSVEGDKQKVLLENLRILGTTHRELDALDLGKVDLTLARLRVEPVTMGTRVLLQDLAIDGVSSLNGDFVEAQGSLQAATLQIGTFAASNAGYAYSARHLHGPTLAALNTAIRDANVGTDMSSAATLQAQQKMLEALRKGVTELLVRDPVVDISRIGLTTPDGEMRIAANLTAPGLKAEDLQGTGPAMGAAIRAHLVAMVDLRFDAALEEKLLGGTANYDKLVAQTDLLERSGFLKRDGTALTAHLVLAQGKLTVNGLPFPAAAPR